MGPLPSQPCLPGPCLRSALALRSAPAAVEPSSPGGGQGARIKPLGCCCCVFLACCELKLPRPVLQPSGRVLARPLQGLDVGEHGHRLVESDHLGAASGHPGILKAAADLCGHATGVLRRLLAECHLPWGVGEGRIEPCDKGRGGQRVPRGGLILTREYRLSHILQRRGANELKKAPPHCARLPRRGKVASCAIPARH